MGKSTGNFIEAGHPGIAVGVETGMRTGEMLALRWQDINFLNDTLQVVKSKTPSGIRTVPISAFCKSELLRWRNLIGPEHSEWVFPSFSNRRHKLQGGRKAWASILKKAGIPFSPIYNLRHHVCFPHDRGRCFPDYDCPDAWTLFFANRSPVRTGAGPEQA